MLLGCRIMERASDCNCCCCCESGLPEAVVASLDAPLCFDDGGDREGGRRFLTVSLGIFSIIRIVRPAQYLVQAVEYCVPEKECAAVEEDDPCRVFRCMPFPTGEFCQGGTPAIKENGDRPNRCGCGS